MLYTQFTTKEQLIEKLGLSKSTFYRRLKALNIRTTGKLISPTEAEMICKALGYSELPETTAEKQVKAK